MWTKTFATDKQNHILSISQTLNWMAIRKIPVNKHVHIHSKNKIVHIKVNREIFNKPTNHIQPIGERISWSNQIILKQWTKSHTA